MKTRIVFPNGTQRGLVSPYAVMDRFREYFESESTIYHLDQVISVPHVTACQLCDRPFSETSGKIAVRCQELRINHELGYVGKICVDCSWYIETARGTTGTPKSVREILEAGHKPLRFDNLIFR